VYCINGFDSRTGNGVIGVLRSVEGNEVSVCQARVDALSQLGVQVDRSR
jgi:hypothetical protein